MKESEAKESEAKESKILTVKDENLFFSMIEERMEQKGFELLDTSHPLVHSLTSSEIT